MPTQYEVINKVTEEVTPVTGYEAGNETMTVHLPDGTPIVFSNTGNVGDLQNDTYTIREVGTHSKPDGTGTVEVTESGIVDSEAVVTEEVVAEKELEQFGEFEMPKPNVEVAETVAPTVAE